MAGLPQFGLPRFFFMECVAPEVARISVCAWPINAPALTREWRPNQFLGHGSPCVVIESGGTFIKTARVPGIAESELQEVQMMTELMAQGAEKSTKRCNVLPNCCPHPDTNLHGIRMIVPEKLSSRVLTDPERPGSKHTYGALRNLVEI